MAELLVGSPKPARLVELRGASSVVGSILGVPYPASPEALPFARGRSPARLCRSVRQGGETFSGGRHLEIGGDPGSRKIVIAEFGIDPSRCGAPADYRIGVRMRQHRARQLSGTTSSNPSFSSGESDANLVRMPLSSSWLAVSTTNAECRRINSQF